MTVLVGNGVLIGNVITVFFNPVGLELSFVGKVRVVIVNRYVGQAMSQR